MTQARLAHLVGGSQSTISRIERGVASADLRLHAAIASVLGLEFVANVYPVGSPVRDAGHVRLMGRLRALLPAEYRWRTEVPLPFPGDSRALDAVVAAPPIDAAFELETRLLDAQALVRRATLKLRDAGVTSMVLVLPGTRANRDAVAAAEPTLRGSFPAGSREILAALRTGQTPLRSGILFA
jgi:DNA-binding XRE family transcriptional regulator